MADIEIVYREGYCDFGISEYSGQCHTDCAGDRGCRSYCGGETKTKDTKDGVKILHFGNCIHARDKYNRKGWSGKRYEMEVINDIYSPEPDLMRVTLGNKVYDDCVKVTLNGECIFNEYDE